MVRTRLEISDTSVPFGEQIPVSINFNIADVREPDKFKSSWSKTINLPESNAVNILFENVFEVNAVTNTFNKNKKTKVKYYVDDIVNLEGDLQLLKITINPDNLKTYECAIKGEGASFFGDIGDYYITGNPDTANDLDFSAYNHTYNRTNQIASRSNAGSGFGYIYAHVENGNNNSNQTTFKVTDFLPMFHVREYVKKIIEKTGRTYTSSILDSAEFRKHVIYPNLSTINLTPAQISNKQYYVGLTSDYTMTSGTNLDVNHTSESSPFFDTGNQSFGTYVQIASNGNYNTVANNVYSVIMTHTDPTVTRCTLSFSSSLQIKKSPDGGSSFFVFVNNTINPYNELQKNVTYNYTQQVATEQFLSTGDRLYHFTKYTASSIVYYNASGIQVTTGTGTVTVKLKSGATGTSFYSLLTSKSVQDTDTLLANSVLPQKIKQKDFLKSIIQMFNLQIEVDKNNPNNLIIETFDVFHAGGILNYENKTDLDKEQTNNINTLDSKRYIFKYKADTDYWNNLFQTKYNEPFGTENINVENEFSVAEKVNEVIFSPTPNVANYKLGIICPQIYKQENGVKTSVVPNVRILTTGSVKTAPNKYIYDGFGLSYLETDQYLYVGHTNDPLNPTYDLNFGLPKEVFYTYVGTFFTNNNLYNRFHKNYILNISDRDAKFITKYLWVNSLDINKFSFRNRLFIDGSYYSVNRIENYTPLDETSTKYELIKLLYTNAFVPTSTSLTDSDLATGSTVTARIAQTTTIGDSQSFESTNSFSIGDYNVSPSTSNNVLIVGDNIIVPDNVDGFVQLNGVYIPKVVNGTSLIQIGSDYTCNEADGTILIDASTTNIDVTLTGNNLYEIATYTINDVLTTVYYGKKITLKRVDTSANTVTIIPSSGTTIEGFGSYTLSTTNTLNLQYNDGNWIII
jgi:hypothetical protein